MNGNLVMNYPEASCGVSKELYDNLPEVVTPECFYRGSTVLTTTMSHVEWVGGPFRVSPGFPLKACGNDGPWEDLESPLRSKLGEIRPVVIKYDLRSP